MSSVCGHYTGDRETHQRLLRRVGSCFHGVKGGVGFIAGYHRLLHNKQEIRNGWQVNMVVGAMLLTSWRLEDRTKCGCGIRGSIMVHRLPESTGPIDSARKSSPNSPVQAVWRREDVGNVWSTSLSPKTSLGHAHCCLPYQKVGKRWSKKRKILLKCRPVFVPSPSVIKWH